MSATDGASIGFEIHVTDRPVPAAERDVMMAVPGFGGVFTDHMVTLAWSAQRGWHGGQLEPYGPITLDPAASVFHYGQEIFEGLKAYRQETGTIATFRPEANAARFNRSAARLAMPALPEPAFIEAIRLLVSQDRDWVPAAEGQSLYLRPFMIATQRGLGVNQPSSAYRFTVIASPVAAYFSNGVQPVSVWLSEDYTRAAPGAATASRAVGQHGVAFHHPTRGRIEARPIQRVRHLADQATHRVARQSRVGVERHDVTNVGRRRRRPGADVDEGGVGRGAQQSIQLVQLAALALPADPPGFAFIPDAPAVQQQKARTAWRRPVAQLYDRRRYEVSLGEVSGS